jgi:hypothetical protein
VRDPRRVLPRAIIIGTSPSSRSTCSPTSLPRGDAVDEIRHSKLVAADVAQRLIGAPGVVFVAVTVMLSTFGTLNATLLTAPRVFFAMADDGLFFRRSRGASAFGTPYVSILLATRSASCSCCCAPSSSSPTSSSRRSCRSTRSPSRRSSCVRGVRLRPPFRTPGYPVVPALFILATLFLLGNAISIRRAAGGRSLCSASSWAGSGCTISPSTRGTSTRIAQRDVRTPAHSIPVLLRGSARS